MVRFTEEILNGKLRLFLQYLFQNNYRSIPDVLEVKEYKFLEESIGKTIPQTFVGFVVNGSTSEKDMEAILMFLFAGHIWKSRCSLPNDLILKSAPLTDFSRIN